MSGNPDYISAPKYGHNIVCKLPNYYYEDGLSIRKYSEDAHIYDDDYDESIQQDEDNFICDQLADMRLLKPLIQSIR